MKNTMIYKDELPERLSEFKYVNGVYMLLSKEGYVLYVGKSKNICNRVKIHIADKDKSFHHVSIFSFKGVRESEVMEARLIEMHKPIYNKVIPKIDKSIEESMNILRRDISYLVKEIQRLKDSKPIQDFWQDHDARVKMGLDWTEWYHNI